MALPAELLRLLPAEPLAVEPIGGSGSNRSYWRCLMPDSTELIATLGTCRNENEAFFYLAAKLAEAGVRVPRVLAVSTDRMAYVQTSLGRRALFDSLDRTDLIAKAIDMLAAAHETPAIDYSRCYPVAEMDRRAIFWDLNYFKYCFLKTTPGLEIDEPALEDDFERLADMVLAAEPRGLMIRDFQSRNVMVDDDGRVGLIDFQGARRGPAHYDVASFLWQARAGFSDGLRAEMISRYCAARGLDRERFVAELQPVVVLRLLQALGAYGFRGRIERKDHFLRSISPALASLRAALQPLASTLPYIDALTYCLLR